MNEEAREALRAAALKGTRQIVGLLTDKEGGRCALGVLEAENCEDAVWARAATVCHLCGATETWSGPPGGTYPIRIETEAELIIHLNNDHKLDFIGIAEKMPQEAV